MPFLDEVYIVHLDGLVVMTRLGFGEQFELNDRTYSLFRIRDGSAESGPLDDAGPSQR
jgi:hypothetical protein